MMLWLGLCRGRIQLCTTGSRHFAVTYARSYIKDHYQILGIGRKATSEEIKDAFFTQSKKCHPDRDPSNPLLHAQFVRLNEAYKVLSKHSSRREYDQILEAVQRGSWVSSNYSQNKTHTNQTWKNTSYRTKGSYYRSSSEEDERFWSQFPPKDKWNDSAHAQENRNRNLVLYCIFLAITSIIVHYQMFSKLKEIRRTEMEEQQLKILSFYNERREQSRVNGFHKQQEILMQKHEERLRKLYGYELDDEANK